MSLAGKKSISSALLCKWFSVASSCGCAELVRPHQRSTNYATLPPLPVPSMNQTLDRLLRVVKPIVSHTDFKKTEQAAVDFAQAGGEGETLQNILEERAKKMDNWLADWWLNTAYLDLRVPLPVNLSPGLTMPKFKYHGVEGQVQNAAELVRLILMYKNMVDTGQIKTEMAGGQPMDMSQYGLMFHSNRIPGEHKDKLRYGKGEKHIAVVRNGHFFKVPVYDGNGMPLGINQLITQLNEVVKHSEIPHTHPVGICTSEDRTNWGITHERLLKSGQNAESLDGIEGSIFVLCLDQPVPIRTDRSEKDEHGHQVLYGSGSASNSGNRWFDKMLQIIVHPDGHAGACYEHTPAEGGPVAALMDFMLDQHKLVAAGTFNEATGTVEGPKRLDFELSDGDKKDIDAAAKRIDEVADDLDLKLYYFKDFGKGFPKSQKLSPDSFCQLAFQLAYYKLHGTCPPTYESGSLRVFSRGRTDTIRLPTIESAEWAQAMFSSKSATARAVLLRRAVQSHKDYTVAVMSANGIDRHLLGYKLAALEHGIKLPQLFESPGYTKMSHYKLGTSQIPARNDVHTLYGATYEDGYGVCYNPRENEMNISISAYKRSKATLSVTQFAEALDESFWQMRRVLEEGPASRL